MSQMRLGKHIRTMAAPLVLLVTSPAAFGQLLSSDQRIMGLLPNYQTVSNPDAPVEPLSVSGKWNLFARSTFDPFSIASAAMGAGFSQGDDEAPNYGRGGKALAERFGAAVGDYASQNLFSTTFATILHQDPRYFREGPKHGVLHRVGYAVSRVAVTRQDSGQRAFNYSGIMGMGLGIAASNLYYPSGSVSGSLTLYRFGTSLMGGAMGNLMSEFWPDIRIHLFHAKNRD